ncbi:MAG: hypothetical protein HYR94_01935, partial [Chloroflexi bacterium]|nr:hypothetical protein [Chloroflexota bacterium]
YLAQRQEILVELGPLTADLATQKRQIAEAETGLQAVNQELRQAEEAMQAVQQLLDAQHSQRQHLLTRQAAAEQQARHLATQLAERQASLTQFAERRTALLADYAGYETEISRLTQEQHERRARQEQLTHELSTLAADLSILEQQQTQQRDALSQFDQAAEQLKSHMAALQRQEDTFKARQDLLGKLRGDMSGYFEGVKAVLQPEAGLSGMVGTVSQVMQTPPGLEVAIEATLGSRLQDVVVESFAHAEAAIAYLKESRSGRATFLPLDTLRPGPALSAPNTAGVVGLASELVTVEPRLRPVVESTLNRTLIVEDLPAARRAFAAMQGGFQIVTREGELMRSGGSVTGGRDKQHRGQEGTFLAREREWRELPGQIAGVTQAYQALSSQLADTHDQATSVKKELQRLAGEQQQRQARRQEVQATADEVSRALEQLARSIGWQQELQHKAGAELAHLEQRQADTRHEMAGLDQQRQDAEEMARQLAEEVSASSAETLLTELSQARATVATIQGRQRSQQALLAGLQTAQQQLARQIDNKQARANTLAAEREVLLQQQQELQDRGQEFNSQLEQFAGQIGVTEQQLAELSTRQSQLEQTESQLRQRLQRSEIEHSRISLEAARRQDELDILQRQIQRRRRGCQAAQGTGSSPGQHQP